MFHLFKTSFTLSTKIWSLLSCISCINHNTFMVSPAFEVLVSSLLLKDNNVWLHLFCLRTPTHNIFIWDIMYSRSAFTKTTNIRYEYTCVNNRFQLSHTIASNMRMICGICLLSSWCLHRSQYQECYNHFHIIDSFVIKSYIWMI